VEHNRTRSRNDILTADLARSLPLGDLLALGTQLRADVTPEALLQEVADAICSVLGYPQVYIRLRDADTDELDACAFAGVPDEMAAQLRANPTAPAFYQALFQPQYRLSESYLIPAGQSVWISRPDNCIKDVWTSATAHHFTFCKAAYKPRFEAITHELSRLFANLPDRQGNEQLALRMNQASRWYPRLIIWILVGLVALLIRRPVGTRTLVALALAALVVIVLNALGLFADPRFALPVAPAFVVLGSCALLGVPRGRR